MASPETDSDGDSFDSILEPPQLTPNDSIITVNDGQSTPHTQTTFKPETPEEHPSPLHTPPQRSTSSPDLAAPTISNGSTVPSTSTAPPPAPAIVTKPSSSTATLVPSQPSKRRKLKSVIKDTPSPERTDDHNPVHGNVLEFGSKEEITRRVAFPGKMLLSHPNIPYKDTWTFQKVFGYDDFFASGFVFVQPNGAKSAKNTMDNAYVFLVLEGIVEATVHQTSYTLSPGGLFQVPRGNIYSIKNTSSRLAKVFFVQARKIQSAEESHASLLTDHSFQKPSSDASMIFHWLVPRLIDRFIRIRRAALVFYQRYLAKYEGILSGRRLYLVFFILGLIVRRLPFIGSPPILNIQLIRYSP